MHIILYVHIAGYILFTGFINSIPIFHCIRIALFTVKVASKEGCSNGFTTVSLVQCAICNAKDSIQKPRHFETNLDLTALCAIINNY